MIGSTWASSEEDHDSYFHSSRNARPHAVTRAGPKGLEQEAQRWRQVAGVMNKLLTEER